MQMFKRHTKYCISAQRYEISGDFKFFFECFKKCGYFLTCLLIITFFKMKKFMFLSLTAIAICFMVIACNKEAAKTSTEVSTITSIEEEHPSTTNDANFRGCISVADACSNSTNNSNCVLFARCKVPSLPFGLSTYAAKKAIVNSTTASSGAVAIINVGNTVGHVAYVKSVSGTTIYIREANWCSGQVSDRSGTKTGLNIVGFYKP
jgi:hypothetical protein